MFIASALVACGDPPPLVTPLPNGYTFHSNGGEFGNIKDPDGLRLAEHFGVRNDGRETWCTDFAWKRNIVICRLIEYTKHGFDAYHTKFFVLDSETGAVSVLPDKASAQEFWSTRFNSDLPEFQRRYPSTTEK